MRIDNQIAKKPTILVFSDIPRIFKTRISLDCGPLLPLN